MTTKSFEFGATLAKASSKWGKVGGVASGFVRDLDGDAIPPDVMIRAIPGFLAQRGANGQKGGPIKFHHDAFQGILKNAANSLNLGFEKQSQLVAGLALPLGWVENMWVDGEGDTHWEGFLLPGNPMAKVVWDMLKDKSNPVALGVSVGGKILGSKPGRDRDGQLCTVLGPIRIDELSITHAGALRDPTGKHPGAYIMAKSLAKALTASPAKPSTDEQLDAWLRKTIGSNPTQEEQLDAWLRKAIGGSPTREIQSGDWLGTKTGIGRGLKNQNKSKPKGSKRIPDGGGTTTGIGGKQPQAKLRQKSNSEIKTDVWGITIGQLTRDLMKCSDMDMRKMSSPDNLKYMTDASQALMGATDAPTDDLLNLVRLLGHVTRFSADLPNMSDYEAAGTLHEMQRDMLKALETFQESMTKELAGTPTRPPGSPGVMPLQVMFPSQYALTL